MRTRSTILSSIFLVYSYYSLAQEAYQISVNDTSVYPVFYRQPTSSSVYSAMHNIWFSNERISYLSVPKFTNLEDPAIPLRDGEGINGNLLEGSVYHQASILRGRKHENHLWQTSRLTFDYSLNIRITDDLSYPQLPSNYIFGLTYEKVLWDSYTGLKPFSRSRVHIFEDWNNLEQPLSTLSINITGHHFSNGQTDGFFYRDTINGIPKQRNDYLGGDFSTNYLQIGLTFSRMCAKRCILSFKFGYQLDGHFIGPMLIFSEELNKSYGNHRLLGFAQYRHVWRKAVKPKSTIPDRKGHSVLNGVINRQRYFEMLFRFEYEYIAGDLSLYPHDNKYRFNPSLYALFTRRDWQDIGFFVKCYYGRDYSNIRFDLPVFTFQGGLSISFNKYTAPFHER